MREIQRPDTRATLFAVVDSARREGRSVMIRHGEPAAIVPGIEGWEKPSSKPSFARLLMAAPIEPGDLPPRDPGW